MACASHKESAIPHPLGGCFCSSRREVQDRHRPSTPVQTARQEDGRRHPSLALMMPTRQCHCFPPQEPFRQAGRISRAALRSAARLAEALRVKYENVYLGVHHDMEVIRESTESGCIGIFDGLPGSARHDSYVRVPRGRLAESKPTTRAGCRSLSSVEPAANRLMGVAYVAGP